jgi:hypothetical protein
MSELYVSGPNKRSTVPQLFNDGLDTLVSEKYLLEGEQRIFHIR